MNTRTIEAFYVLSYFQGHKPSRDQVKSFLKVSINLRFQRCYFSLIFFRFPKLFFLIDGSFRALKFRNDFNKKLLIAMYLTEFTNKNYSKINSSSGSLLILIYISLISLMLKIISIFLGSIILIFFFKK
jgi:hypothetical protein